MNNDGRCVIIDHTDIVSATVINHLQVFESYTGKGLVYVCVKITQFEEQIASIYN